MEDVTLGMNLGIDSELREGAEFVSCEENEQRSEPSERQLPCVQFSAQGKQ